MRSVRPTGRHVAQGVAERPRAQPGSRAAGPDPHAPDMGERGAALEVTRLAAARGDSSAPPRRRALKSRTVGGACTVAPDPAAARWRRRPIGFPEEGTSMRPTCGLVISVNHMFPSGPGAMSPNCGAYSSETTRAASRRCHAHDLTGLREPDPEIAGRAERDRLGAAAR